MPEKENNTTSAGSSAATTRSEYFKGFKDGLPIGLGYLSVSFAFGITAVNMGIPPIAAILISMTCVTSAGQVAGIGAIAASGSFVEIALAQLIINLRYSLMSLSLSQKLCKKYSMFHRFTTSFGVTDEVFAVASARTEEVTPPYMYGLITLPYIMWSAGTALGALLGGILPDIVKSALGIAIYGMFIAIVVPPAKRFRGVLIVALMAAALSCIFKFVPFLDVLSGFSVIICTVIAATAGALLFPRPVEDGEADD